MTQTIHGPHCNCNCLADTGQVVIAAILDKSGSMYSLTKDTIGGFNTFLDDQKKVDAPARMSITLFGTSIEKLVTDQPLANVEPLNEFTYIANGASTRLNDAVGKTLTDLMVSVKPHEKAIVLIMTDGQENDSREWQSPNVKTLVEQCQAKGWQFVFLGADANAWKQAATIGVQTVGQYRPSAMGTQVAYANTSANVGSMRRSYAAGQSLSADDKNWSTGEEPVAATP